MRIGETLDLTWDVFTKPADGLPDGDRRFRARLLSVLLLAIILFSVIGMWFSLKVQGRVQPGLPLTTAVLIAAYGLSRTQAYNVAAALAIAVLGVPPIAAVFSETDYSSGAIAIDLLWLMLPMLLAGLLLSVKGVLVAAAVILMVVSSLPLVIPALQFSHVAFMLGFFSTVSVLIALTANIRRRYIDEVHRQVRRQERVEQELLRLKEFNENIVNNMVEGIVVQRSDGCFTFVNPAAAQMLGYARSEMVGMHWKRIIPPAYHAKVEAVDERRADGETSRYELELLRKDGKRLPVMVSGSPREGDDGSFSGTLAVFTNISERKQAEEELKRLNEDLEDRVARRTAELVAANERLEELDRLKTKFIADMSHELRTPAMNLRLYLALLKGGDPAKQDRHLSILEKEINRLTSIVEGVFDVAHMEEGWNQGSLEAVEVNELVWRVEKAFRARVEEAGLALRVSLDDGVPPVLGASGPLGQAIGHLMENALKYTHQGEVSLETQYDAVEERVGVAIRDTGMGVPEEEIPYLFERFYRSRRVGQSKIPGAGVGLAVAKKIVTMHGGDIVVKSREGEGSTFTVWLPAHRAP